MPPGVGVSCLPTAMGSLRKTSSGTAPLGQEMWQYTVIMWAPVCTRTRQSCWLSFTSERWTHPVLPLGRTGRYTFTQSLSSCLTRNTSGAPDGWGLSSVLLGEAADSLSKTGTLGTIASATVLMLGLAAVRARACGAWPAGWLTRPVAAGTPFCSARAPTKMARATTARKASPTRLCDARRATDGDVTGGTSRFG